MCTYRISLLTLSSITSYSYLVMSTKEADQVGVIFKQILDAAIADEATTDGRKWLNSWSKKYIQKYLL